MDVQQCVFVNGERGHCVV